MVLSLLRRPLVLGTLGALAIACATSNGAAIPEQDTNAPPIEVPGTPEPVAGTTTATATEPPVDAGPDAHRDAGNPANPAASAKISEVYIDDGSLGIAADYVEISAPSGAKLVDLEVRLLDDENVVKAEVDLAEHPTDVVPASGFWVVGGGKTYIVDSAGHLDRLLLGSELNAWGFASAGSLQLVLGSQVIDTVAWTTAGAKSRAANGRDLCESTPTAGRTNGVCL